MNKRKYLTTLLLATSIYCMSSYSPAHAQKPTPIPEPTAMPLPKFFARHVEEGNKLFTQEKFSLAKNEYLTAKTINPDYYPAYVGLGLIEKEMGNLEKAVAYFQEAISLLNPSYADDHVKRGDFFASKANNDIAWQKAYDDYWEVLRIDPQAGTQYTIAKKHLRFGNEKKAITALESAIKLDEDYADPYFLLGNIYYKKEDLKKAVPAFEDALEHDTENPQYNYFLANAYYRFSFGKKGEVDQKVMAKAVERYEKAIEVGVRARKVHFNLGSAYLLQDRYDLAIQKFNDSIERGVDDEEVFYNMGNAYYRKAMKIDFTWDGVHSITDLKDKKMNETKFEFLAKAIDNYNRAVKKKSDYSDVYFDLGVAYYRMTELHPSAKWIRLVLNSGPLKEYYAKGSSYFYNDIGNRAIDSFHKFQSLVGLLGDRYGLAGQIVSDIRVKLGIVVPR